MLIVKSEIIGFDAQFRIPVTEIYKKKIPDSSGSVFFLFSTILISFVCQSNLYFREGVLQCCTSG